MVNTGNANAGTGKDGLARALSVCSALASQLKCKPIQVLPFSTGVIMEPLPVDRIRAGLPVAVASKASWLDAAEAIMTTDTVPKAFSRKVRLSGGEAVVTGIAKGAGMIRPDMATMLGFVATDAKVAPKALQSMVKRVADRSFNCVDRGRRYLHQRLVHADCDRERAFGIEREKDLEDSASRPSLDVSRLLAQAIIRDGEGATKFVTVTVERGRSEAECRKVAYAIAHSPLVKTAFFASDPNLGRILAAIGYAGVKDLDTAQGRPVHRRCAGRARRRQRTRRTGKSRASRR